MRFRWTQTLAFCVVAIFSALTIRADADGPMLHEYMPPDPSDDASVTSKGPSGSLPSSIKTPSGTITPPDVRRTPAPDRVYQEPSDRNSGFRPDRDTRRPHVEPYDDPFSPTLTPFKRMFAYDAVADDYTLIVRDTGLHRLNTDANERGGEEHFFGDMSVQLRAGEHVRIPSVGPDTRLIKLVTHPDIAVTVWRDGADNWFARADKSRRVRMISELAIDRDAFGSDYAEVPWSALPPVPIQPAAHRVAFQKVASKVGISRNSSPKTVVETMVEYFRAFEPSADLPREHGDIYLDLALTKKGVCRHRSFAFFVTALNIGLPTRFVHNEAHAWVEVHDGTLWHRIDLGGAALDLAGEPRLDRPPHNPPPDPYRWPAGRDSGSDLARRDRQDAIDANGGSGPGPTRPYPSGTPADPNDARPAADITLVDLDADAFRGLPLRIRGTVRADGRPCARLRVDVMLQVSAAEFRLGSLSTNAEGEYDGAVVLPPDVPLGDHELFIVTAGDSRCGPGREQ